MREMIIQLRDGSRESAADLISLLDNWVRPGAAKLEIDAESESVEPLSTLIIVGSVAVGAGLVTRIADWIRARNSCLVVVDARHDSVKIIERCDIASMRGKTIIIDTDGQQLRIERHSDIVDLDALLTKIVDSTAAEALKTLRQSGGAGELESGDEGI